MSRKCVTEYQEADYEVSNMYIEGDEESRKMCAKHICEAIQDLRKELLTGKLKINGYNEE